MRKLFLTADRSLRAVEFACACIAAVFLVFAMALLTVDTFLRYVFNAPLGFQLVLTQDYLLVGFFALSLPWAFRTGGYIRITGLVAHVPQVVYEFVLRSGLLLSAVYVGALAWTSCKHFIKVFLSGEYHIGVVDWPLWLSWVWVPVGCGLLAFRLVLTALGSSSQLQVEHNPESES